MEKVLTHRIHNLLRALCLIIDGLGILAVIVSLSGRSWTIKCAGLKYDFGLGKGRLTLFKEVSMPPKGAIHPVRYMQLLDFPLLHFAVACVVFSIAFDLFIARGAAHEIKRAS